MVTPTPQHLLNRPPKSKIVKPVDITFAEATAKNLPSTQTTPKTQATRQTTHATIAMETFDQQVKLQKMAHEVKTTLQAKFDKVFAKMQQSLNNMETKVE